MKHWMHQVKFNISVAPVLMEGIGPPEMVIMRGAIKTSNNTSSGLIILLDDKAASARLLKLTTQLETAIKKEGFSDAWQKAGSAKEMKAALIKT